MPGMPELAPLPDDDDVIRNALADADLDIVMAASDDAIVMVEGGAHEVDEKTMVDALLFGQAAVKELLYDTDSALIAAVLFVSMAVAIEETSRRRAVSGPATRIPRHARPRNSRSPIHCPTSSSLSTNWRT